MKTPSVAPVLWACLVMSGNIFAQDALDVVSKHVHYTFETSSPEAAAIIREAALIIGSESGLKARIESEPGRIATHDALIWGAARSVAFNQNTFLEKFPNLFKYAHALFVSTDLYKSPRVIYQLNGATGEPEPRMLFGDGVTPMIAKTERIEKWNDDEGLADWIGEYSFEQTNKGPYLVSTSVGRETTGATSIRHVLGWVRVEATRLVPERFEAFDVPLNQKRQSAYWKKTALPELNATLPPLVIAPTTPTIPVSDANAKQASSKQNPPPHVQQSASKKAPETTPSASTPIEAPASSTAWAIVAVVVVATLGLLWFLLKRRWWECGK